MMDIEQMNDRIEAIIGGRADSFEAFLLKTSTLSIEVKDSRLETLKQARSMGACLRTIHNNRLGFSYSFRLNPDSLRTMVDNALQGARGTDPDPAYGFPGENGLTPTLRIYDHSIENIPRQKKVNIIRALEDSTRSFSRRVKRVRKATYSEYIMDASVTNSLGLRRTGSSTIVSLSVMAIAEERGDSQMGWESDFSHFLADLNPEKIGQTAAMKAVSSLGASRIKSLSCPAVFDRETAAELLSILSPSLSSESVQKRRSFLRGKTGAQVFSKIMTISDNGLNEKGVACFPFDGEGVKRGRTELIKEGKLLGFLYDTFYARKAKTSSTGNSSRTSMKLPPGVGASNFSIEPGARSLEDMLREAWSGIYVTELVGVHTADPVSGDFSLGVTGRRIIRGKLSIPVRGMAVSGNLFELFRGVKCVGSDHRFYGPWGAPSLLLERVSLSGR